MAIPIIISSIAAVLPALLKKNNYNLWTWDTDVNAWHLEQTGKARTLKKYAKRDLIPNKVIYRIYALSIKPTRPPKGVLVNHEKII